MLVREPVTQIQKKTRLSRQQIWRNKKKAQEEINKEIQNRMLSLDNYGVRKSKYPQRDNVNSLYSSKNNIKRATATLYQSNSKKRPGSKACGSSKQNKRKGCVKRKKNTLYQRARKKYKRAKKIVQTAKKKNKPAKIIVQTDASKYGWNPPLETVCKRLYNTEKMKRWEGIKKRHAGMNRLDKIIKILRIMAKSQVEVKEGEIKRTITIQHAAMLFLKMRKNSG